MKRGPHDPARHYVRGPVTDQDFERHLRSIERARQSAPANPEPHWLTLAPVHLRHDDASDGKCKCGVTISDQNKFEACDLKKQVAPLGNEAGHPE